MAEKGTRQRSPTRLCLSELFHVNFMRVVHVSYWEHEIVLVHGDTRCCKTLIIAIVHPQTLTNHAAIVPKLRNLVLLNSKSEQNHGTLHVTS